MINKIYFVNLRTSEIHLFYNLQLFYWHFLEILWLFIFLIFYNIFSYQCRDKQPRDYHPSLAYSTQGPSILSQLMIEDLSGKNLMAVSLSIKEGND